MHFRTLRFCIGAFSVFLCTACGGRNVASSTIPQAVPFQRVQDANANNPLFETSPGVTFYKLGDAGTNAQQVNDLRLGADGTLYYTTSPALGGSTEPTSGEIGNFNVTTHAQNYETVAYVPGFIEQTTAGVWVTEGNNASGKPTIDRYTAINGSDTAISVPIGPPDPNQLLNGLINGIAVGSDKQVWFGAPSGQVGEIEASNNAVNLYTLTPPSGSSNTLPQFMVLGSDNHLWVTDAWNAGIYRVTTGGSTKGANAFFALPNDGSSQSPNPQGVTSGTDGKIYAGILEFGFYGEGDLDSGKPSASPSFSMVTLPSIGIQPYVLAAANGKIYYNDNHYLGLGVYDTKTGKSVILPLSPRAFGAIAVDSAGNAWLGCIATGGVACIEHVSLTSTWHVYPSTAITLYTQSPYGGTLPPGLIGIGESGNSGPFTAVSGNKKICTASVISGFDHDVQINPVAAGKCTVSITDAHSRTVKVTATVISGKGFPEGHVRL